MSDQHAAANRYLNLLRDKRKRDQGWAYLGWLKGCGIGHEPYVNADVKAQLDALLGPEPFVAVGAFRP